jgi:hypothetical protein
MVEATRSAGLALASTVTYNGMVLPFAYSPLAFLAAAALTSAGVSSVDTLRYLPLAANTAALFAFAFLARITLPTRLAAVIATFVFAILPGSFVWQIMGGGLTRSFGFCFALLGLGQAYLLATRGRRRNVALLAIFAALTASSHLEMAWFLTLGTACILLAFGRRWDALSGASVAAVGAALLASPWWVTIIARHGVAPLFAASQTGSVMTYSLPAEGGAGVDVSTLLTSLIAITAFVGVIALGDRRFFVLGAVGVLLFLESRSFAWLSAPVLALALGGFADHAARYCVRRYVDHDSAQTVSSPRPSQRVTGYVTNLIAVGLVVLLTFYLNGGILIGLRLPTTVLAKEERTAMAWTATSTPPSSRFLVISGDVWAMDRSSEWFPVLADRVSVATVQGAEWLPNREFAHRIDQHRRVQECGDGDSACLAVWEMQTGKEFDYVYVATREFTEKCCARLRAALEQDPRYTQVFANPGAAIFVRK